ncbi:MAG: Gfo/Idh/MocA family oxidoreductase [Verrucomicrobiota bacterium]
MNLSTVSHPPLRLAIAGMGRIAEIQAEALAGQSALTWVAACDPDASRATVCPAGVPFFRSLTEMLASTTCDAVLVSTPTDTHFDVARQVIASGRHLLLEKPAAVNPGEVQRLRDLADSAGVLFQTAFHMSRGSETDWLAAHLAAAGPDHPRICGFASVFHDPLYLAGQFHPRAPSVLGSWVDSGINALSVLARFIPPESLTILAANFQRASGQPVQDVQSHVTLTAPGMQGTIHTDWTTDSGDKTTTLHLTNGQQWQLDHNQETATLWASSQSPEAPSLTPPPVSVHHCQRHPSRMVDHYLGVLADFAEAVRRNQSNAALSLTLHQLLLDARITLRSVSQAS